MEIRVEGDRRVKADRSLLRELFYNLINNSIEWGAKRIDIRIGDDRLEYSDDGKGIPDGERDKVFMPYYSSNPKGMGLGMAVVKKIVEDHGWSIKALPSEEGAHFLIEFRSRN
ncbi:MAG: ATP-binding protein [Aquificota bacterium]|nr:ATP-binding protein [Aquificota bacterium]